MARRRAYILSDGIHLWNSVVPHSLQARPFAQHLHGGALLAVNEEFKSLVGMGHAAHPHLPYCHPPVL